jgi:hypothetical protein
MLEILALGLMFFVGLFALVALPFLLLGGLFKLVIMLILLPFRVLGAVAGALGAVAVGLGKLFIFLLLALFLPLILVVGALAVPLLPVLALVGLVWLLVRAARPRPAPGAVGHGPGVSTA